MRLQRRSRLADKGAAEAIDNARQTEYRLCLRQQVVRAAISLDSLHDEPHLPLYDCTPNKVGKPATLLTPAQSKAFLHYVRTAKNLP